MEQPCEDKLLCCKKEDNSITGEKYLYELHRTTSGPDLYLWFLEAFVLNDTIGKIRDGPN